MNKVTLYYESLKMLEQNINELSIDIDKLQGELAQLIVVRDNIAKRLRDAEYAEYSASALHDLEEEHKKESETPDCFLEMINEEDDYAALEAENQNNYDNSYERSSNPEYLIASTSYNAKETYIFEGNADGEIVSFNEYGGLAERWGDSNWEDHEAAIKCISGHEHYHAVSREGNHTLYKLTPPDEFTYFDGDESDRISY